MHRRNFNLALVSGFAATQAGFAIAQDASEIVIPEMAMGDENAPVKIVEYASFTCPHCASFHNSVFDELKKNYIDTGKVYFVNREVYFDGPGLWAAMLARCDGGARYFGISDLIYKRQREWTAGESGAEIAENLYKIGRIAGMKDEDMQACLQNRDVAEAMVARFKETSEADGVTATPTLFVNGSKYSNMNYEDLAAIIDAELGA